MMGNGLRIQRLFRNWLAIIFENSIQTLAKAPVEPRLSNAQSKAEQSPEGRTVRPFTADEMRQAAFQIGMLLLITALSFLNSGHMLCEANP